MKYMQYETISYIRTAQATYVSYHDQSNSGSNRGKYTVYAGWQLHMYTWEA